MRILFYLLILFSLTSACTNHQEPAVREKQKLDTLFSEYIEDFFHLNPVQATVYGDHRFNDTLVNYLTNGHRQNLRNFYTTYLNELQSINKELLNEADKISASLLLSEIERNLEGLNYPSHILAVNQNSSFQNSLPLLMNIMPFETAKDYYNYINRLKSFPQMVDTAIANMETGIKKGIVQPDVIIERSLIGIKNLDVSDPKLSVFYIPVTKMPDSIDKERKKEIANELSQLIENDILPAYQKLADYLGNTYLSHCRKTIAYSDLPNGESWYKYLVRFHTTTNLTPDEIYNIGLKEVERIHAEIDSVKQLVGFKGTTKEFFKFLRSDPQFIFENSDSILADFERIRKKVETKIPDYFKHLPSADFEIREVEAYRAATAAGGSLQPASVDGSRPSIFYVNTYDLKSNPRYNTTDLFLHEALPGHHLQIAIQQEKEDLPVFRQIAWFTAYGEGWALYAEELGKEMGLLNDPYQYYGKLNGELWRAIRLVVDVGIHYKGWSRQEVIDYMLENSSTSLAEAVSETDRYIVWPGQALAYKIGELKIKELRRKAEYALGDKFNLKEFHDVVLRNGTIPLSLLEEIVNNWIDDQVNIK